MQLNGKILLLVAVGVGVYVLQKNFEGDRAADAANETATPAASTPSATTATSPVRVRDRIGNPVQLDLADGSPVVVIGTWDDKSKTLINALSDPALQQYLHGTTVTYLIERDEWRDVKRRLRDAYRGVLSEEQMDAQIAARRAAAGNSGVYDESVVDGILRTGSLVYYFDERDGIVFNRTPSFHSSGSTFNTDGGAWLSRKGVPADVARTVMAKYEPKR